VSASSPSTSLAEHGGRELAVVGFDTATADTAVCATRGDEVLHESLIGLAADGSPRHSTALLVEVERAAAAAGGWQGVGTVAAGLGPGSFTGVRIAVATAGGLAASLGLRTAGVCTLDAIGRGLGEIAGASQRLAVLDARRGEVFAALYSSAGKRLWEPLVAPPAELAERVGALSEPLLAAGSGAVRFRQELASRGVDVPDDADPVHRVAARHVCALGAAAEDGVGNPLAPIYLRPPDAERWRERHDSKTAG
jgi:tRNA threonylcarbamoyladenosine biosynthesis protein TsaB